MREKLGRISQNGTWNPPKVRSKECIPKLDLLFRPLLGRPKASEVVAVPTALQGSRTFRKLESGIWHQVFNCRLSTHLALP